MSILSLTFHAVPDIMENWKIYSESVLPELAENLLEVNQYILSAVDSGMIDEGMNTNFLLIFDDEKKRQEFLENEFENIRERIENHFAGEVMIFKTQLDPFKSRL